ncbi:hypothetical protein A4G29_23340 [Mycobacterium kansasii]|nr:hypothetical protein A4G29_23340 [Mycobacterium kansasii]
MCSTDGGPPAVAKHLRSHRKRAGIWPRGQRKILFANVSVHDGRWWIAPNVEAADLHPNANALLALTATTCKGC